MKKVSPKSENSATSDDVNSFLTAQFDSALNGRINMEGLIDKEIQYYFTLFGLMGAASGLVLQTGSNVLVVIGVIHLFIAVLIVAGFRLLRRLTTLSGMLGLYEAQAALIRRRFVEIDETLRYYIILPVAYEDQPAHPFVPVSKQMSMRLIPLVNSTLLSGFFILFWVETYLYFGSVLTDQFLVILFITTIIVSLALGILFFLFTKRNILKKGDDFSQHINEVAHQMLLAKSQTSPK